HVARALAALPADRIFERAVTVGRRMHYAAAVILLATAGLGLARAWSVLEGLDVMLARGGVAPFTMKWLGDLEGRARPPDYLHMNERDVDPLDVAVLPYGTLITVRGEPLHTGRRLFLSDGK